MYEGGCGPTLGNNVMFSYCDLLFEHIISCWFVHHKSYCHSDDKTSGPGNISSILIIL